MPASSSSLAALSALVLAALPLVAAITPDQIASVFGQNAQGLTGGSTSLSQFDLSIVTNSTHALYTLNATRSAPSAVGWMGVGVGTAMANADFLVSWPTPASTSGEGWTMSHRISGGGEVMPMVATTESSLATPNFYTLVPSLSSQSSDSYTCVSFLRQLTFASGYPAKASANSGALNRAGSNNLIYASSTVAPASTAQDATLTQHDQAHAPISLDLSQPITLASAGGTNTTGGASGSTSAGSSTGGGIASQHAGRTKKDMVLIAHATAAGLAAMIFMPLAVLIGRFFRATKWFPLHVAFNLIALLLITVAFGAGVWATGGAKFGKESHYGIGLAIFIIIIVQACIGYGAHRTRFPDLTSGARFPTLKSKSPVRHVHMLIGLGLVGLSWYNVHEGFQRWALDSNAQTKVPKAVTTVFWILLGIVTGLYALGWVFEGLGKSNHQALRSDEHLPTSTSTQAEKRLR